jgi:pilus assembly protein CpaF
VPARLEALGLLGGVPREALHAQIAAALQIVIQLRRQGASRTVEEVCLLLPAGARRTVTAVTAWDRHRGPGPAAPQLAALLHQRGVTPPLALAGARS